MAVCLVGHEKGGSGATTLAALLALGLGEQGREVLLVQVNAWEMLRWRLVGQP